MNREEERLEELSRLFEDARRAMNERMFDKASRLALRLTQELSQDETLRARSYPICIECNGFAEVVDPRQPEKKTLCTTTPSACPGNRHGRMTPDQFQAYLDAKLTPLAPTGREVVPATNAEGFVERRGPDDMKPFRPEVLRDMPGPGVVDRPEGAAKERPELVE